MNAPISKSQMVRTQPEVFRYAWRARKRPLLLVLILVIVAGLFWLADDTAYSSLMGTWGDFVEPFIGIATLVVAGMVWWGELAEDWIDSLPKRLHAVFVFEDEVVMRCNYAKLSSESDIRQLGQQIGSQLLTSMESPSSATQDEEEGKSKPPVMLTFRAASIDYTKIGPHQLPSDPKAFGAASGQLCNLYEVRYELLGKRPQPCRKGDCLIWDPPFDSPHCESSTSVESA